MPATSAAQRRLFAIAEHHPDQLRSKNKGLADLPQKTLHDFAATPEKGLPRRKTYAADGCAGASYLEDGGSDWLSRFGR